jgi:rhodanese-related sulfurtransferase
MKFADKEIDFRELLKPEYIGHRKGSSMRELKKAAEDHGMYAQLVGKLTSRELRNSPYPMILHVKYTSDKKKYDHFKLFLRTESGKAVLFDPPEPIRAVPFHELAPRWRWDGYAVIISDTAIDTGRIFATARKQFAVYVSIAIGIILMVHWSKRKWLQPGAMISKPRLLGLSAAQGVGFVIVALLCGGVYHFANDEGFLAHANAAIPVQQAHAVSFIPKVSKKTVSKLLDTNTVFIDARLARDFHTGHLGGAINIPVDSNDTQRHNAVANIAKDTRIVIYCQSAGCPYAGVVSKKLIADGFSNISIFKGGWREWEAQNDD